MSLTSGAGLSPCRLKPEPDTGLIARAVLRALCLVTAANDWRE